MSLRSPPYLRGQVVARGEVLEAVQAVPVPGSPSAGVVMDHLGEAEESSAGGTQGRGEPGHCSCRRPRTNTLAIRAPSYLEGSHELPTWRAELRQAPVSITSSCDSQCSHGA